jgi:hypothetical protein
VGRITVSYLWSQGIKHRTGNSIPSILWLSSLRNNVEIVHRIKQSPLPFRLITPHYLIILSHIVWTTDSPNILWNPKIYNRDHKISVTGPCPGPDGSCTYNSIQFSRIHFSITFPITSVLPIGLWRSGLTTKAMYALLFSQTRDRCPAHLILFNLNYR